MQISLFDGNKPFRIDKPIRLIELFGGIGAQAKALDRLGVEFENHRLCEIDKYAVKSYNAIHGTGFTTSDITKIHAEDLGITDTNNYCYIMAYSFPCQDLSIAGKQHGMAKGGGTRSGLLWEVERLLTEICKGGRELPQVLLMENVPEVIGAKNIKHFAEWVAFLDSLGYKSKWQILNAKDYGVPQNRNRCFMVSILGDYYYEFPKPIKLKKRLKDLLDRKVDEKYYLKDKTVEMFIAHTDKQSAKGNGFKFEPTDGNSVAHSVLTRNGERPCDNFIISRPHGYNKGGITQSQVYPTVRVSSTEQGNNGIIENLTTNCGNDFERNGVKIIEPNWRNYRIRKLTPKECWRLMNFDDEDIDKAKAVGISDSQLYKQAGNSIVVAVLVAIFKQII